jgi:hypothetical protein
LLVGDVDSVGFIDGRPVGKALGRVEGDSVGYIDAKDPSGISNVSVDSSLFPKNIVDTNTTSNAPSTKAVAMPKNATISHLIVCCCIILLTQWTASSSTIPNKMCVKCHTKI